MKGRAMVDDEAATSPELESFPIHEEGVTHEGSKSKSPQSKHAIEKEPQGELCLPYVAFVFFLYFFWPLLGLL